MVKRININPLAHNIDINIYWDVKIENNIIVDVYTLWDKYRYDQFLKLAIVPNEIKSLLTRNT